MIWILLFLSRAFFIKNLNSENNSNAITLIFSSLTWLIIFDLHKKFNTSKDRRRPIQSLKSNFRCKRQTFMSLNREEQQKIDTFFRGQRALLITHPHEIVLGSNDRKSSEKSDTGSIQRWVNKNPRDVSRCN